MALSSLSRGWARSVTILSFPAPTVSIQKATIVSAKHLEKNPDSLPPFAWYKEKFSFPRSCFSNTTRRFNDNTRIIIVEGNVASGITDFSKELASELGMVHIPYPDMDWNYTNHYGIDRRPYLMELPESNPERPYDISNFLQDPTHRNAINLQLKMYKYKYFLYMDALTHLLNTGQGAVVERSPYSDWIFIEAMYKFGYISRAALNFYYDVKKNTIYELLKPHLCIYLDTPTSVIQKKIAERNSPGEANSPVLTEEYLKFLENSYKYAFLKDIGEHAELLVYDWTEGGDTEIIVEDIERIDFDKWFTPADQYEPQLNDWKRMKEMEWGKLRYEYTSKREHIEDYFIIPKFDVPEVFCLHYDAVDYENVVAKIPGEKFAPGFNPDMGDNVWFKTRQELIHPTMYSVPYLQKQPQNVIMGHESVVEHTNAYT